MTAVLTETELPELSFPQGLAGFPTDHRFTLSRAGERDDLLMLTSLDTPGVEFLVVPPSMFFPDYAPEIDDISATRLGLTDGGDALLLSIVTIDADTRQAWVNLLAPLVINQTTRHAAQVVLNGSDHALREPLLVP